MSDESGWKQVHGDVFRPPSNLVLFSAILGSGHHIFAMGFVWVFLAITSSLYSWYLFFLFYYDEPRIFCNSIPGCRRGGATSSLLTAYVLTSFVGGYSSGSYYKRCGGREWKRAFVFTAALIPGAGTAVFLILDVIAEFYSSSAATPMLTIVRIYNYTILSHIILIFFIIVVRRDCDLVVRCSASYAVRHHRWTQYHPHR